MSRPPFLMAILTFILLIMFMGGASASRPLGTENGDYTMYKPKFTKEKGGKDLENCLPKGRRHSSAPSRYINYQPLGSTMCSSRDHQVINTP
ncbi:hypothetical protein PHJA_002834300 [Phtheirospermum japonicum]|uniref:Uncharacterized protein n=1 Tax=Phtheirospermum japonicum TaxID=374723 RepID=A0A830D8B4_9LAMI|nr:hypothetical protein PHJA_002834300 [Phtheirospermum japonicum]